MFYQNTFLSSEKVAVYVVVCWFYIDVNIQRMAVLP